METKKYDGAIWTLCIDVDIQAYWIGTQRNGKATATHYASSYEAMAIWTKIPEQKNWLVKLLGK